MKTLTNVSVLFEVNGKVGKVHLTKPKRDPKSRNADGASKISEKTKKAQPVSRISDLDEIPQIIIGNRYEDWHKD